MRPLASRGDLALQAWLKLQRRLNRLRQLMNWATSSPTPYEALSADDWRGKPAQQESVEVLSEVRVAFQALLDLRQQASSAGGSHEDRLRTCIGTYECLQAKQNCKDTSVPQELEMF